MQKIHVKGDGLAGMLAVNLFNKYYDVSCSHEAPPFDVGISNTLGLFKQLRGVNNPSFADLDKYNGLIKLGVSKEGFGNNNYFMSFTPPEVSVQFNSVDFINFLKDINNNVQYIDGHNISNDSIIIDCSGYANLDDNYQYIKVPVNTVLGYTYNYTYPEFQHTKLIAGKYGYISMIPTKNKCFVSYIFNNEITNEETIAKELGITEYKIFNFKISNNLIELRNLLQVAELIIYSALERKESRGLHFSKDYPQLDEKPMVTILDPTSLDINQYNQEKGQKYAS